MEAHNDIEYLNAVLLFHAVQGSRKFVLLTALEEGQFMDRNGEFQLELSLANIRSVFEHKFKINQSIFAASSKLGKFESSYFCYGHYDWSISVYPNGRSDSQLGTKKLDISVLQL